jgi:hypothetical protein
MYTIGLLVFVFVVVLMYISWVYLIDPEWSSESNNVNFSAYTRRMQVLLQANPSNLNEFIGTCDAAVNCSWLPISTCGGWGKGQQYTTGFRDQKHYDPDKTGKLRAFKDLASCKKNGIGWDRFTHYQTCIDMNEVYCGSLEWVNMFTGKSAIPWVTSSQGVVRIDGYDSKGDPNGVYVPFDARKDLVSDCIAEDMNKIWKVLSTEENKGFLTTAIAKIISVVAPQAVIPAGKIATVVANSVAAFGEFVIAYQPSKMDVYSCQTHKLIESRGVDSGGALAWIGNVRTILSKTLTEVTGGQIKNIDSLTKQEIQTAWERAFPNVDKKTSLLYNYFEKASETAVQRMINMLIGPGPDYTKNNGDDTYEHFQLANQLCSLGVQQTDDQNIHDKTTVFLESMFHHDKQ